MEGGSRPGPRDLGGGGAEERRGQRAGKFQTIERRGPATLAKVGGS